MTREKPSQVYLGDQLHIGQHWYRCIQGGRVWVDEEDGIHGTAFFEQLQNIVGGDEA